MTTGRRTRVGVLYPPAWYGERERFSSEISDLASLDPRIDVDVCTYEEPRELRVMRAGTDAGLHRHLAPALSAEQREMFARVEIVITQDLPYDVAAIAPHLRWVQGVGAGTEHLESAGLSAAGIRLTSSSGSNAVAIAEFVIGRVLAEWKRFRELDAQQVSRLWDRKYGEQLAGSTVGLLGLGAINSAIASRLRAFDVRLIACRRTPSTTAPPGIEIVYPPSDLDLLLAQSDIVVAAIPGNEETRGLIDAGRFAAMKAGAFFVNVGRGSLVDEAALVAALSTGHLRGAALDVTVNEPVQPDDPLWDAPNLYLSPHAASVPSALFVNLHRLFRENVARYLAGQELVNEVRSGAPG